MVKPLQGNVQAGEDVLVAIIIEIAISEKSGLNKPEPGGVAGEPRWSDGSLDLVDPLSDR